MLLQNDALNKKPQKEGIIERILDENPKEEIKPVIKHNINDVYKFFRKYMHINQSHEWLIDVCLATRLTVSMKGTPIWLIIIGASGDGKSEILMTLNNPDNSYLLHEMTSKTLVSGNPHKVNEVELMDGKLVLMPDMAQILHLHPSEKSAVWSQLRELYDGRAGRKTGMPGNATSDYDGKDETMRDALEMIKHNENGYVSKKDSYEGLRITMIGASTPAIDEQILIFNQLGTREMMFRTYSEPDDISVDKLMDKVIKNDEVEEEMRRVMKGAVQTFVKHTKMNDIKIPKKVEYEIRNMAKYLRVMRADANTDRYTGQLVADVYAEQPTRILKQLKRLYMALMSLDDDYKQEKALKILRHIVNSSILPLRVKILEWMNEHDSKGEIPIITSYEISQELKVGHKSIESQLNILWNLGLIKRREEIIIDGYGTERGRKCYWKTDTKGINLNI